MFNNRMIEDLNTQLGISQPEDQETLRNFTRQRSSGLDRSTGKIMETGKSKVRLCTKTGNILPKKKEILVSSLDALNVKSVKKISLMKLHAPINVRSGSQVFKDVGREI
jgi:hypothetical protein